MLWRQNENVSFEDITNISQKLNSNDLLIKILMNRNKDEEYIRILLKDIHEAIIQPELLVNGNEIAQRIKYNIDNNSDIYIFADYDSDGLNSGFIMESVIKDLIDKVKSKSNVELYYPERNEGYGLSIAYVDKLINIKKKNNKNMVVITVDNGISQIEEIDKLLKNDIEVLVTDHHQSKEVVPNCLICDPHNYHTKQDNTYKHLCGAGVAFKICELLQKLYGFHKMTKYVMNLAIATITDMMPLTLENMAFIIYGIEILNSNDCPANFKYLKEKLNIDKLNSINIGWEIGPLLNACGRMGNTKLAGDFLKTSSIKDKNKILNIINEMELLNNSRKEYTKTAKEKIKKMNFDDTNFIILVVENIPEGILGILATQVVNIFGKPAMVLSKHGDFLSGSARSIPGLDLHYLFNIELSKGNIINFGGHSEAAGICFEDKKFKDLKNSLNHSINEIIKEIMEATSLEDAPAEEPYILIDECIDITNLNEESYNLINEIIYDNQSIPKPIFALLDCKVVDYSQTKSNPKNIWLTIRQDKEEIKLWCENMYDLYKELHFPSDIHLAGYIEKNFLSYGKPYTLRVIDIISAN